MVINFTRKNVRPLMDDRVEKLQPICCMAESESDGSQSREESKSFLFIERKGKTGTHIGKIMMGINSRELSSGVDSGHSRRHFLMSHLGQALLGHRGFLKFTTLLHIRRICLELRDFLYLLRRREIRHFLAGPAHLVALKLTASRPRQF